MKKCKTEQEIRQTLEAKLGFALPDAVWGYLCENNWTQDVLNAETDEEYRECLSYLFRQTKSVLRLTQAGSAPPKTAHRSEPSTSATSVMVSALLAELFAPLAEGYRKKWLGGRVLSPEEVASWLQEQARQPLEARAEDGDFVEWQGQFFLAERRASQVSRRLALYELYQLCIRLQEDCLWTEEQALRFVLCNEVPPTCNVRASVRYGFKPAVPTVTIAVPLWTAPQELTRLYTRLRAEYRPTQLLRAPSRRFAEGVRALAQARLRGEPAQQVAQRLGVKAKTLSMWYSRARSRLTKMLRISV